MTVLFDADRALGVNSNSTASEKWVVWAGLHNRGLNMFPRVNKSGADIATGNVLVDDVTTLRGVVGTTTAGDLRTVYVVPQELNPSGEFPESVDLTIPNNDESWLYGPGAYVPHLDCDASAVAIGEFLKTSTTTKKATGTGVISAAGTPPPVGSFAIATSSKGAGNGQVAGIMLGMTEGGIGGRAMATTAPTQGQLVGYNGSTWLPVGGMYLIEDLELGSDTASFDFQSIPATFKHLEIILHGRSAFANTIDNVIVRLNNDSGTNYDSMAARIAHSAALTTGEAIASGSPVIGSVAANSAGANIFSPLRILVPDYLEATQKHVLHATASPVWGTSTGTITVQMGTISYRVAGAISRITILPGSGNWMAGSRATLYGIS